MGYRVICTTPFWHLNGVNSVSATLVRGLCARGVEAEILLTGCEPGALVTVDRPSDVPFRQLQCGRGIRARMRALAADLAKHAPCVYLPGYDYECSGVSGILPRDVVAVGVVHSDDPLHYAHVRRLGRFWNAIVCVSRAIQQELERREPELRARITTIHNGVDMPPPTAASPKAGEGPLQIVFAGRIVRHQKRVQDLPVLMAELQARGVDARFIVAGGGDDLDWLRQEAARFEAKGMVRFTGPIPQAEVLALLEKANVFLLTSDFEGLPVSLLEAMARGCVPVVTDIASGIPEIVDHGANGYRLPVGDMARFADTLALLWQNQPLRRELSAAAIASIRARGFTTEAMAANYVALFERAFEEMHSGVYRRPQGKVIVPPEFELMNQLRCALGHPVQRLRSFIRRARSH